MRESDSYEHWGSSLSVTLSVTSDEFWLLPNDDWLTSEENEHFNKDKVEALENHSRNSQECEECLLECMKFAIVTLRSYCIIKNFDLLVEHRTLFQQYC